MGLEWFLSFLRPGVLVKQTPERANVTSADRLSQRDSNDIIRGQGQHIVLRGPCERVGLQHHLTIDTDDRCSFLGPIADSNHASRNVRKAATSGHHSSGTPAKRIPEYRRSRPARNVGLSLGWEARNRPMVKPGLSASPAAAAVRASSTKPCKPSAAASKK